MSTSAEPASPPRAPEAVQEIKVVSHGLLTAGGVAALIIGTIVVFPPGRPTFPGLRASVDHYRTSRYSIVIV